MTYEVTKDMGQGIYFVRDETGDTWVAREIDTSVSLIDLDILCRLRSPFVLRSHGFAKVNGKDCIITPAYASSMDGAVVPHDKRREYAAMMARAVYDLHRNGIFHMDLTPSSFFIRNGHIVLGEFSSAMYFRVGKTDESKEVKALYEVFKSTVGTEFLTGQVKEFMGRGAVTMEEVVKNLDGDLLPSSSPPVSTECVSPPNYEAVRETIRDRMRGEHYETFALALTLYSRLKLDVAFIPSIIHLAKAIMREEEVNETDLQLGYKLGYKLYVPNQYTAARTVEEMIVMVDEEDPCIETTLVFNLPKDRIV